VRLLPSLLHLGHCLTFDAREEQSGICLQLSSIKDDCRDLKTDFSTKLGDLRSDLLKAIEANQAPDANAVVADAEHERKEDSLADIARMLRDLQLMTRTIPVQHRILRQLIYNDMRSRHTQIHSAGSETCGWILETDDEAEEGVDNGDNKKDADVGLDDGVGTGDRALQENLDRREARRVFRSWLREGQNVLHISGNPGSGKSTLMKFIAGQSSTEEELKKWAGTKILVLAEFYFWSSGTTLQRTLQGLYRSLLFEILSRCPELMEVVFPRQWKRVNAGPGDRVVESMDFGDSDIEEAFAVLLEKKQHAKHRFCFFIDGLDEYPGNDIARESLALKLQSWTEGGDIKICASSRPNREFDLLSYRENLTIHLHLLNRPDIHVYCLDRFRKDREVQKAKEPYRDLVNEIVDNARGVFLWAYLVVEILLEAVRHGASHNVLKEKLKEIPPELDELYASLRKLVAKSPTDLLMSNRMLLLAVKNPFNKPLNAIVFSWLDGPESPDNLEDPSFPNVGDRERYSEEEIAKRLDRVQKQVGGLTKGLLEVVAESDDSRLTGPSFHRLKVQFFHRTARDYLLQSAERLKALQGSFPGFEQVNPYGRIRLAEYLLGHDGSYALRGKIDFERQLRAELQELRTLYPQHSLDLFRKFQAVTPQHCDTQSGQPIGAPFQYHRNGLSKSYSISRRQASFLHFAAYHGFDEFVINEIAVNPQLSRTTEDLSLLIAAIDGGQWKLSLALLDTGIALDDIYFLRSASQYGTGNFKDECPVWVLASACLVQWHLSNFTRDEDSASRNLMRLLVQHGTGRGDSFSISIDFESYGHPDPDTRGLKFRINDIRIGDLLVCFERHFKGGEEPEIAALPIDSPTLSDLPSLLTKAHSLDGKFSILCICWRSSCLDVSRHGLGIRIY